MAGHRDSAAVRCTALRRRDPEIAKVTQCHARKCLVLQFQTKLGSKNVHAQLVPTNCICRRNMHSFAYQAGSTVLHAIHTHAV